MSRKIEIALVPELAHDGNAIRKALLSNGLKSNEHFAVRKRSIDARRKPIIYRLTCEVWPKGEVDSEVPYSLMQNNVSTAPEVYIAGSGPCGLFAAIKLIEDGFKPIILERGKDVRSRRRDLANLNKSHIVNPESNYCYGEGGAGTYSDGKLYTRSKKRGSVQLVLQQLVAFGADPNIAIDAHPHIGTNKLPKIITTIREYIISCGGEVRFDTKLTDIEIDSNQLKRIQINSDTWISTGHLILATGHSARDIFTLLHRRNVRIESKPFALGVRIEHPQNIIDQIQYKCESRGEFLPAAPYSLVHQVKNRGVYSFCMCPGGIIAPCATSPEEIVTNGWSPSKRNNPYANSGMVVSITPDDYDPKQSGNPLLALDYQAQVEKKAWQLGGGGQIAPAQRVVDFVNKKVSSDLPDCSYQPGLNSAELRDCLPAVVHTRLQEALVEFGKKMKGYYTNEAVLVATESRTSSPVRIPRDKETFVHTEISGLYPAGEGAGYAGGIVSAAIDGQNAAEALALTLKGNA